MDVPIGIDGKKIVSDEYIKQSRKTIVEHVKAMLEFQNRGAKVFDYGNNIRGEAEENGVSNAFNIPGFVPE